MPHFLDRYCSKLVKFLGVCANTAREYRKKSVGAPCYFLYSVENYYNPTGKPAGTTSPVPKRCFCVL